VTDEDDILAAEFALGLLDAAEAQAVQDRARTDATLSLRIAWWRDQLAPLASEVETPPPAGVWQRIDARLPGNDNSATLMQRWRAAAVAAMSVAAALVLYIGVRPMPEAVVVPPIPAPMIAALSGEKGAVVAVSYNATSGKLVTAPTVLDPGKGDAELWIIPEGGKPVSLGVVDAKNPQDHNVPEAKRAMMQPGATFAITQEVKNGSPDGNPHGPIVAAGKIIRT
jgi:anti-sigma-K factor RskA